MKKHILFISVLLLVLSFLSCKQDETVYKSNLINRFIYDGMSQYYLWESSMINKKPNSSDTDPFMYFDRIKDANDRFSWLTDDVEALMADFSGTPLSYGFSISSVKFPASSTEYYAIIKYVFPNTPASKAGLRRADLIGKINDQAITKSNYGLLFDNQTLKLSIYKFVNSSLIYDRDITITPLVINTDPVLLDTVYNVGGKKVAYLFYTDFIGNYNNSLFDAFSKFKSQGASELILDLRYNHGGGISAATYLSSFIAPASMVANKSEFTILSYNSYLNNLFDVNGWSRSDSLGSFNSKEEKNPLLANLNLNKVYIIATRDSYSASELTTFCLKSFMPVVHIGENTGGKYVASFTIHPYDDNYGVPVYDVKSIKKEKDKFIFKNWAMQPIVAKYTNKSGIDFSNPGYLVPDYMLNEGGGSVSNWKQIGDITDTYVAQALWLIEGNTGVKPSLISPQYLKSSIDEKIQLPVFNDLIKSSVNIDKKQLKTKYNQIVKIWLDE